jgi:hypothetical protein
MERSHDIGCFGHRVRRGGNDEAGMVVDEVEDLDVSAIRQEPVGDVGLPALVGQLRTL